ncbi:hypothetical protein [Microtetraspora niveoalba]|uniref:hypothetical protein n=1 Tax=Microtetraspora niveoalba TaxID=46175 RepID=UPI0012FCF121|nr:hypothetical protein [Microtetraspora niveoalba]
MLAGALQIGDGAAEYRRFQSALPCRAEPAERGDVSYCHEFRARVTEKIHPNNFRGPQPNPRLEVEALDRDRPRTVTFPVGSSSAVAVGDEILVREWEDKVVQIMVAGRWWDTPEIPVDDPTKEVRIAGLFGAVMLFTIAFGVLPRIPVRTPAGGRRRKTFIVVMIPVAVTGLAGIFLGSAGWTRYILVSGGILLVTAALSAGTVFLGTRFPKSSTTIPGRIG